MLMMMVQFIPFLLDHEVDEGGSVRSSLPGDDDDEYDGLVHSFKGKLR